jgi:hypothetical protein
MDMRHKHGIPTGICLDLFRKQKYCTNLEYTASEISNGGLGIKAVKKKSMALELTTASNVLPWGGFNCYA